MTEGEKDPGRAVPFDGGGYDIASGTWRETWPMQFSRAMHSMVAIDNAWSPWVARGT